MEDLTFVLDNVRVDKLVADVKHKFSVFSVSNTLFPKNQISDSELNDFFSKISKDVFMILNAPVGTINRVVDNKIEQYSYSVSAMAGKSLDELADSVLKLVKPCEVIGFYDLTYEISQNRYNIRLKVFEDDLRLKAYKRDQKIDELLDDK